MSEESTQNGGTNYVRKAGDLSVFINNRRETDKQPLMWGKLVVDPKALLEELTKNPTPDGFVELRVSLWGYTSKAGAQFWSGLAKISEPTERATNSNLPPGAETGAAPADGAPTPQEGDLPF